MKKIITLFASLLIFGQTFASYVIIYNNDGTKRFSYDTQNGYYYSNNFYDRDYYYRYDPTSPDCDYYYRYNRNNTSNLENGLDYRFTHFPSDLNRITYSPDYYPNIKYKGYTTADPIGVSDNDLDDMKQIFGDIGYFKFFRFGYYRDSALENITDNRIDLSYLNRKRLRFPIAGIYVKETMILLIYKDNLTQKDKDLIGRSYSSSSVKITKYNNWYVVNTPTSRDSGWTYQRDKYFPLFRQAYRNYNLLTFQVGQNPFNNYVIQNFSDDILQLEILRDDLMYGFILSLKNTYSPPPVSNATTYGGSYSEDENFMNTLNGIYENVYNYYRTMGGLPKTLGSMSPNFFDITSFNDNNYDTKYYTTSAKCYSIGFRPTDPNFKSKYYSSINKDGYWMTKVCIK